MKSVIAATLLAATTLFAQVRDYREIKTPPMKPFTQASPKRIELANGMVIFLMEDHELPVIRGSATVRGGERDVPANLAGLADIYGQSWRTGGTEKQTGDQLDDFLETRAAHLETGADDDSSFVSMNVMKGDFDAVFPLFVELLQHPAFRQDKIDLAKTQEKTGISRRNDDADEIAEREANKLVYGATSSYEHQAEYATVDAVTRESLLAFHDRFVHPNNIIIGVSGDFDSAAMEKKLRAAFGSWKKGPQASKTAPTDIHPATPGVYFVNKDDVTQSNIYLVHLGLRSDNPDYYAIRVMNEILSGDFSGRLMNEIRTARGLAYSVRGGIGTSMDHPGAFSISLGTKSSTTVEAINATRGVAAELQTKPVTEEELAQAKDTLLNRFIFTRDSRAKVLNQRVMLEFYGYPADWYDRYVPGVQKVTAADVQRVAKQYVHPNDLATVVVGNEKEFDKPLSTLGKVTPIDIAISEPGAKKEGAKATAGSNEEGRALLEKVRAFVGDKEKIAAIKSTHAVMSLTVNTPQGEMAMDIDSTTVYPDREHTTMKLPMGEMTLVLTPDASFVMTPMGTQDMPGAQKENIRRDLKLELLPVLMYAGQPEHSFTAIGSEKVGNIDAKMLEVSAGGSTLKWWIDPATGRLLRKQSRAQTPQGPADVITDYAEWKSFNGLMLPWKFTTTRNGEKFGAGEVKSIEINPTVDPAIFVKK